MESWTPEMVLAYVASLDDAARVAPHRLPDIVKPESTRRLLESLRVLLGRPRVSVPVSPVVGAPVHGSRVMFWDRVVEVLRKRGPTDTRTLAAELEMLSGDVSCRMTTFKHRGWVAVVGQLRPDGVGKPNNIWQLTGVNDAADQQAEVVPAGVPTEGTEAG